MKLDGLKTGRWVLAAMLAAGMACGCQQKKGAEEQGKTYKAPQQKSGAAGGAGGYSEPSPDSATGKASPQSDSGDTTKEGQPAAQPGAPAAPPPSQPPK